MKRLFLSFLSFAFLLVLSMPVFASDLAFDPYVIDYAPYSSDAVDVFGDSMRITLKSIGNNGLLIFAITASIALIQVLFEVLVMGQVRLMEGVKHRAFNRKVKALDFKRNFDDIVEDKVRDMEVSYEAKKIFQRDYSNELFDDGMRRLQESFTMRQSFSQENNYNMVVQRLRNMELRDDAFALYAERHPDADVQHRLQGMETRDIAATLYTERHPDADVQHRLKGMEARDTAADLYMERNPNAAALQRLRGMVASDEARAVYRDVFPESELKENIHRREVSAQGEMEFHKRNPYHYGERKDFFLEKAEDYYSRRKQKDIISVGSR